MSDDDATHTWSSTFANRNSLPVCIETLLGGHGGASDSDGSTFLTTASPRSARPLGDVDPITTQVIRYGLLSVAEQMKGSLVRAAFSPVIYELLDFAVAIYDRDVRLLGQASGLPIFMGTLGFCVEAAIASVGGNAELQTGDVILLNVPYATGGHPQDAAMVMPIFVDATLMGFSAVKAHLLDVGGKDPYATDTIDVYQEGTIFPGVKIFRGGEPVADIIRTIVANSRMPRAVVGDLQAELVSLRVGGEGLTRIIEEHGIPTFLTSVEHMLDHGETVMREYIFAIPDGEYAAKGALDGDGITDESVGFDIRVVVQGSDVMVDFTSAPDARAGPVNCPLPDTVAETRVAIMMLAGGGEEPNEGHFRPISVLTRPGSLFHPLPPSPCFLVSWATLQAMEVIYAALAAGMPDHVPASSGGDVLALAPWGIRRATGEPWGDCNLSPVGQGASSLGDGASALIHISESATQPVSVELTELRTPWHFEHLELAPDSGGPGRYRGGLGVNVRMRATEEMWLTAIVERTRNPPWGLQGGSSGRPNRALIHYPDGRSTDLTKVTRLAIPEGTVIELFSGGGGGYGPPSARSHEAIMADIRAGYCTASAADEIYGIARNDE